MNKKQILVSEWMSQHVVVVRPDTLVSDAYDLMMRHGIRRLPVVVGDDLVGIVSLGDLREARPSSATSFSIYELNYLLSRLSVERVMTHGPYTVTPGTPIQEAARIMLECKVSGLPVIDEQERLVGIITESDIFRMLIDQWNYFTTQDANPGLVASLIAEAVNV
jgi:acetoin utilization protein AcuB